MAFQFRVSLTLGVLTLLCGSVSVSAAENASYRATLTRSGDVAAAPSASATANIKVHVVRDLAGKIVHGYVDFNLDGPLSGNTAVSELRIETRGDGGGGSIAVPATHLPRNLSGNLHIRSSAPVPSSNPASINILKALLEGSTQVYVTLITNQGELRGQARTNTTSVFEAETSQDGVWKQVDEASLAARSEANVKPPNFYRTFHLDQNSLQALLRQAPMQSAKGNKPVISMPMPDGQFSRFSIEESPVMEPALAAKFPDFKTYRGRGIDNRAATMRFDSTKDAVHAIVLTPEETVYINPVSSGDREHYAVYYKRDLPANQINTHGFGADTVANPLHEFLNRAIQRAAAPLQIGDTLRTYRLAIATTKGFTADPFFGGGGDGVAARNTTLTHVAQIVNIVNALYERDVAIQFVLIGGELSAIFDTSSNPDPGYTDGDTNSLFNQNQGFLDAAVGSANYDIGHIFGLTTPGSAQGLAGLGVTCDPARKASAVTLMGCGTVTGDFNCDTQVLEHEMAHQFNANHTTNSTSGFCGQERNSATAFEVGSGSTILANAGSCDPENLQQNTDNYFHGNTLDEIDGYVAGAGACFVGTATGNTPPSVTAPPNMTVPMGTPFTLTATPGPSNSNNLTFNWEEFDIGAASPPQGDEGTRPLFRTVAPNANPSRTFPNMTYVLNNANQPPATIPCPDDNTQTCIPGETLPVTERTMNFRVTVRDNNANGGGTNNASLQVTSTTAAGPFLVTQPNTATTWQTGSTQTVTWSVANTDTALGANSVANVNLLLSADGGNTFPTILAQNVPNIGSATITAPNAPTASARVMVQAVGNIFFDVSDVNFAIVAPGMVPVTVNAATTGPFAPTGTAVPNNAQAVAAASSSAGASLPDLTFTVDGCSYKGSHTFMFVKGSKHTFSTVAFQCTGTTQSTFKRWSDCTQRSQTIIASSAHPVYTAFFDTKFEVKTGVAPSGSGSVTPASGKFFADGSTVKVVAVPNPGYVFSYWTGITPPGQRFPGQPIKPESSTQEVVMNAPKNLTAHFTEGPTQLAGVVASKAGASKQRVWTIQVDNSGPGAATAVSIKTFTFKQTYGQTCKPVVTTSLPASVANIAPGASSSAPIGINFSACAPSARFTVAVTMTANAGKATGSIIRHNEYQ